MMATRYDPVMALPAISPRPRKLVSRVTGFVMEEIRRAGLRPLDRLPSERELAHRLSMSRSTVTTAYAELEQQGVLRRLHGKGAFLCPPQTESSSFSWSAKIARSADVLDEPVLEMLARRCADNIAYPLSAGTPSLEIFPKQAYCASVHRVMSEQLPSCLAVAPTEGQWKMRQAVGQWTGVPAQNVMILAGAQEGVDLIARCMVEPGDFVVVDSPTYPGATQSFRSAGARLVSWETDWSISQLEDVLLRFRPKLIFTMPTFHNPTGRVMSLKTRLALLALAHRYQIPIVEDDVYSRSYFGSGGVPESLYKLDSSSQVISISTFSKLLAPGLRLGWLTAPLYMLKQLSLIKMRSTLFTPGLSQMVLADLLQSGVMDEHLIQLRQHHAVLCRTAMDALQPAVDAGLLRYRVPNGSLYLWCKLLIPLNIENLYELLEARGLSVAPGAAFFPDAEKAGSSHFRICFTATTADKLREGLGLLCEILQRCKQTEERSHRSLPDEPRRELLSTGNAHQVRTAPLT